MSTVKWTRQFQKHGLGSLTICQPSSPIAKEAERLELTSAQIKAGNYISPLATWHLGRAFDQHQIKAVFFHTLKDLWIAYPALLTRPNIKAFGFARMFLRGVNKKDPLHSLIYSRLQKVIALSQLQKSHLLDCLPLSDRKITVIPNGVDTRMFRPRPRNEKIRQEWGVQNDETLIGLIGRLDRQKGSAEFIEAAYQVSRRHPKARFVLVGGETADESGFETKIKKMIQGFALQKQVVLTKFRTDVAEVHNALDIFVMPSYEENFANVLLEAMASGLPCIGTNTGGTPEMIQNGVSGLLIEPRSASSIAQGIERLLSEPDWANSVREAARRRAVEVYDLEVIYQRVAQLLDS